jgi:sugar phosphate permease
VSVAGLLAVLSMLSVLAGASAVVRLHRHPTGLDPVRDAVSDYGNTPFHPLYRLQVVAYGVAALLLTGALADGTDVGTTGLDWLVLYGAARIAIAGFMIDRDPALPTRAGRLHWLLATLAFTAIAVAATTIGADIGPGFHALGWVVAGFAIATAVARLLPPLARWFGAVERGLYLAVTAWLLATAVHVLTVA